jgi:hypothetical protein
VERNIFLSYFDEILELMGERVTRQILAYFITFIIHTRSRPSADLTLTVHSSVAEPERHHFHNAWSRSSIKIYYLFIKSEVVMEPLHFSFLEPVQLQNNAVPQHGYIQCSKWNQL